MVKDQTVQTGERPQINGRTHTHGRYQTYYRPCYVVDKYEVSVFTHYEDVKGDEKMQKLGWFGG